MGDREPRLGLRANAAQFWLLVAVNALVGAMVGLERSVLPLVGEEEFGIRSKSAILAFVLAFGATKAVSNLVAGGLTEQVGRRRLLVAGWLLAVPVPVLIAVASSWEFIVAANVFLGASQGLAWSMTVLMKIDLVGPRRRGLALGLNESAGYLGLALAAFATAAFAATYAPRTVIWVGALVLVAVGTTASALLVRDTAGHVALEQRSYGDRTASRGPLKEALLRGTLSHPLLRALSQAGLVNNLNDAVAWALVPLYLAANGASVTEVGVVAALYPAVWGAGQLMTGWLSDHVGRKPLIVAGMAVQAGALGLLVWGDGAFGPAVLDAILLGVGTALVYPTLLAAVSDAVEPAERAPAVGVYRFWRDAGFVVGAVACGLVADTLGAPEAILVAAALTAASGVWVAASAWTPAIRRPLPIGSPQAHSIRR